MACFWEAVVKVQICWIMKQKRKVHEDKLDSKATPTKEAMLLNKFHSTVEFLKL